jgi:2-polyprenyl-3-methyl-5-hydroxy-6-metoxy-1,4-benzoquinol methylase
MGLAASDKSRAGTPRAQTAPPAAVVWHELECGHYRADLPLWRELAEEARIGTPTARILDVGAGTGRVSLELARAGHAVTALDLDPELLGALSEHAASESLEIEMACADARSFALDDGGFALCIAPMQTVQLLDGSAGRAAFLERARAHLLPGALLACAIVAEIEPFDCATGDLGPSPELARIDGVEYVSHAVRVAVHGPSIRIERERSVQQIDRSSRVAKPTRAVHAPETERDVIDLDRVSARELRREGLHAGFTDGGVRDISATDDHVGSAVVMLHA